MNAAVLVLLILAQKPDNVELVRGQVETRGEVWVGQRVIVVVKLYSPTYFASAAAFDLPSVPGVVILPPKGRPSIGTEEVNGDSYTTQTHELAVYPQRAGAIRLPPIRVRFTSDAGIGKPPIPRQGATKEMTVAAKMPPGAEGLSTVITTSKLTLREAWKPAPGKAKPGGAFMRTVTMKAADVPGMVLPPMRWEAPEGVGVYPAPARVADPEGNGERVESVTYVCEKPGTYRLPGVTLAWWDAEKKKLRRERLPSRTIEVEAGPPPPDSAETATPRESHAQAWTLGGVILTIGIGLMLWIRKPLGRRLAERRAAQANSEATYFSHVHAACREGDPLRIEQALLAWLDRVPTKGRPRRLADLVASNSALAIHLAALQDDLYGKPGSAHDWSANGLLSAVEQARETMLRTRTQSRRGDALPPLNPEAE